VGAIGKMVAQAIVPAGIAQLVVTSVGFLHLRRGTAMSGKADNGWRQKTRQLDEPLRRRFGLSADARQFFALAVPGLVAAGIPQLKLIAGAMVASSSQAAVSWLYYANRLYELPLGRGLDRHRRGAGAYHCRGRAKRKKRCDRSGAITGVRDRPRLGASLRRGFCGVGGADRGRPVRARRLRPARYHGRRGGTRGDLRRIARARARKGARRRIL